jgi:hypothetical protein
MLGIDWMSMCHFRRRIKMVTVTIIFVLILSISFFLYPLLMHNSSLTFSPLKKACINEIHYLNLFPIPISCFQRPFSVQPFIIRSKLLLLYSCGRWPQNFRWIRLEFIYVESFPFHPKSTLNVVDFQISHGVGSFRNDTCHNFNLVSHSLLCTVEAFMWNGEYWTCTLHSSDDRLT